METILLTSIGSTSADIAIQNYKKAGFRVVRCDINQKELLVVAYDVDAFYNVPYVYDTEKYLSL